MSRGSIILGSFAATALLGCGAASPSSQQSGPSASATVDAGAWRSIVSTDASKLSADFTGLSTPLGNNDFAGASAAVNTLAADVSSFQNDLAVNPAPPQFTKSAATLSTALGDYSTACQDASSELASLDAGQIATATTLFGQGNALLNDATAEIG